MPSRLH
jgi:hypothetical protein